ASVREVWIQGIPARAAPKLPYTIRFSDTTTVLPKGYEHEPNDAPGKAKPLDPDRVRVGRISHMEDMDLFVLPPIPLTGQILTASVKAPSNGAVEVLIVNAGRTISGSAGVVEAGMEVERSLFIAPVGPQPLHLGVRAASDANRHQGMSDTYTIRYQLSIPGPDLLRPPPAKAPKP
ncbi:MAG: hypothetical protein AAFX99_08875, partial [Myxococcota bacterium]